MLKGKKGEVEKIQYLMIALKWYNKFIKRNLKLEFDTTKICSCILSRNDKKQVLDQLLASFEIDEKFEPLDVKLKSIDELKAIDDDEIINLVKQTADKLKPINCLSKIANLPSSEYFLTQKKLSTSIKEIALLLAAIIPVLITVLQFILPLYNS